MRRRDLSDQELDTVVKLQQLGASWLKIQRETHIPRRTAKRAYEDWERSQSLEDLKMARRDVAGEEFRKHISHLTQLAECLVDYLHVPASPNETADADQVLYNLWLRDIRKELETHRPSWATAEKAVQRTVRQNRMIFKSLQDHTRRRVRWEALDEWEQAWNRCIAVLAELRAESSEMLRNILNQKPNFKDGIEKKEGAKGDIERIMKLVLEVIWRGILNGKPEQGCSLVQIWSQGEGTYQVASGGEGAAFEITFTDKGKAEETAQVCNWVLQNLCRRNVVQRVADTVHTMQARIGELDEMTDPLILRPLILRTRCDLCPA